MKALTTDTVVKLAISILLAVQVTAVTAGDNSLAAKDSAVQEQSRVVREAVRSTDAQRGRLELKDEQSKQHTGRKTGGYVSIISVIINDALGHANKDIRARRSNAAGKISF